jgi:hypothetical protein
LHPIKREFPVSVNGRDSPPFVNSVEEGKYLPAATE